MQLFRTGALADVTFALLIPFMVGGGIAQDLVLQAWNTAVIFIVHIRIPEQGLFLGQRSLVGSDGILSMS